MTITGLYTPQQALLAQAAGAAYAAPYLGRMADGHLTRGTASNEGEALVLVRWVLTDLGGFMPAACAAGFAACAAVLSAPRHAMPCHAEMQ